MGTDRRGVVKPVWAVSTKQWFVVQVWIRRVEYVVHGLGP